MKPFFKKPDEPKKAEEKDEPKKKPQVTKKTDEPKKDEPQTEQLKTIIEDKDRDFTLKENVEICLIKYRNQLASSRRNLSQNIEVLHLMMAAQKENADFLIEILLVLITSEFATAKTMP